MALSPQATRSRTLITLIAAALALTAAIAIPLGVFALSYENVVEEATAEASVRAISLSQYIYGRRSTWRNDASGLGAWLALGQIPDRGMHYRVLDSEGHEVFTFGPLLPAPVVLGSSAVYDGPDRVATLEVRHSLHPHLIQTGLSAALSVTLAALIFFSFRALHHRIVRDSLRPLEESQAMLRRHVEELRRAQAERDNLQRQLSQAQRLEVAGRLAGGFGHNFNNLLSIILGNAEMLEEDLPKDSEQGEFACQIKAAGQAAGDLVSQILTFTRKQEPERHDIDPKKVVADAREVVRSIFPPAIRLDIRVDERSMENVRVYADPSQLKQVLLNLCTNARDAIAGCQGRVAVELTTVEHTDAAVAELMTAIPLRDDMPVAIDGGIAPEEGTVRVGLLGVAARYVRLSVQDSGSGMTPAVMKKMFEPFFTTKDIGKGTGLGLSAVHGIVSAHEGAIVIRSAVGRGTAFDVFLPCSAAEQKDKAAA